MIVILLTLISLSYVYLKNERVGLASAIYLTLVVIFHSVFLVEVNSSGIDYFISDELAYIDFQSAHGLSEYAKQDRILWFYYHELISMTYDADGLFNKLASLPLLPLILYLVYRLSGNRDFSVFLFLFCPYVLFIMQSALRDMAIFFLVIFIIHLWAREGERSYNVLFVILISLVFLFMLRPFSVFIVALSIFLYEFFDKVKGKTFVSKVKYLLYAMFVALVICGVFYALFKGKIDQYIRTLTYFSENGLWIDESKSAVPPSLSLQYFSYAIIRYISTPLPTSLLERFLTLEVTQFGYLDDVIRFLNQSFYYLMLSIIGVYLLFMKNIFKHWSPSLFIFFIFTLINSFIYALYYAGGGHSRLKIALFVMVFLAFCNLKSIKNGVGHD